MDTELKRKRFIRERIIATGRYPVIRYSSYAKVQFVIPREAKKHVIGNIIAKYGETVRVFSKVDFNDGFLGFCLILSSLDNEADVLTFLALNNVVYSFDELPNRGYVIGLPHYHSVKEELFLQNHILFLQQCGFKIHRHKLRWLEAFDLKSYKEICTYFRQRCIVFESFSRAYYTDPTKQLSEIAYISCPPNRSQDEASISFFENYDYEELDGDLVTSEPTDRMNLGETSAERSQEEAGQQGTDNSDGGVPITDQSLPNVTTNVSSAAATSSNTLQSTSQTQQVDKNSQPFDISLSQRSGQRRVFDVIYESEEYAARAREANPQHAARVGVKDVDYIASDESLDNALMSVDLVIDDSVESMYNHPSDSAAPPLRAPLRSPSNRNADLAPASFDLFEHLSSSTVTDSRRTRSLPNRTFSSYAHLLTRSRSLPTQPSGSSDGRPHLTRSRSLPARPTPTGSTRRLRSLPHIQRPASPVPSSSTTTHAKAKKTRRCLSEAAAFKEIAVPDTQADMFLSGAELEMGDDDVFETNDNDIPWYVDPSANSSSGSTIPPSGKVADPVSKEEDEGGDKNDFSTTGTATFKSGLIEVISTQSNVTDAGRIDWDNAERAETSDETEEEASRSLYRFYPQSGTFVKHDSSKPAPLLPQSDPSNQGTIYNTPTHNDNSITTTTIPITTVSSLCTLPTVVTQTNESINDSQHVIVVKNQARLILTDGTSVSISPIPRIPPLCGANESEDSEIQFCPLSPLVPEATDNSLNTDSVCEELNNAMIETPSQEDCMVSLTDAERAANAVVTHAEMLGPTASVSGAPTATSTQKHIKPGRNEEMDPTSAPTQILTPQPDSDTSQYVGNTEDTIHTSRARARLQGVDHNSTAEINVDADNSADNAHLLLQDAQVSAGSSQPPNSSPLLRLRALLSKSAKGSTNGNSK